MNPTSVPKFRTISRLDHGDCFLDVLLEGHWDANFSQGLNHSMRVQSFAANSASAVLLAIELCFFEGQVKGNMKR